MRVFLQIIFLSAFVSTGSAAVVPTLQTESCDSLFGERLPSFKSNVEALELLFQSLPTIFQTAHLETLDWYRLMTNFALPGLRLRTKLLVVGLVGASNTGKSTLFNALPSLIRGERQFLLDKPISSTGVKPGLTLRMIIATANEDPDGIVLADLLERYGRLETWESVDDAIYPGNGLLVKRPAIPENVAFVDAPDFDSGAVDKDTPDNLEHALSVICPADALIVLSTPETIRNQRNLKMLLDIFRSYGFKKTILILRSHPKTPYPQANAMLIELANSLYGTSGQKFPEGVLGSYLMPYSFGIPGGEEHPELIPLNATTPPFQALVDHLNRESYQIKEFSLRNALETITVQVERLVKDHLKSQLAMGLYKQALKSLTETAAREALQDFPYGPLRDKIRKRFLALNSGFNRKAYPIASVVSFPERYFPFLNRLYQQYSRQEGRTETVLRDDHRLHDRIAVSSLTLQLHNQLLSFDRAKMSNSTRALAELTEAYYKLFPEELDLHDENPPESKMRIRLPKTSLLGPAAQKALTTLLKADTEALMAELGKRLDKSQFDYQNKLEPDLEIVRVLEKLQPNWLQQARSNALSATTLLSFAAPLVIFTYFGMGDNMLLDLLLLAAGTPMARPVHKINEADLDQYLSAKLNEWFHNLQSSVTSIFFDEITNPLMNALEREKGEKEVALRRIQHALKYLNPNYSPLPLSLSELQKFE